MYDFYLQEKKDNYLNVFINKTSAFNTVDYFSKRYQKLYFSHKITAIDLNLQKYHIFKVLRDSPPSPPTNTAFK